MYYSTFELYIIAKTTNYQSKNSPHDNLKWDQKTQSDGKLVTQYSGISSCSKELVHGHHCIDAPVSLPPWRWCLCQRCSGIVAVIALTLLPLVSLPMSHGHCLQHCTGAVANIARASSTLSRQRCRQHHLGVVTIVALASFPLLHWHLFQRCLDVDAIIALTSYSLLF